MSYNTDLQENNAALEEILETVNNLPDSGGNVDLGVTGATVGQTVKISAVDENGVPTAWEPVDFPSSGSGSGIEWKTVVDFTTAESVTEIVVDKDIDGKPFELAFAKCAFYIPKNSENAEANTGVWVYVDSSSFAEYRSLGPLYGAKTNNRSIVGDVTALGETTKIINGFFGSGFGSGGKDANFSYLYLKCTTTGNSFPAGTRVVIVGIPANGGVNA